MSADEYNTLQVAKGLLHPEHITAMTKIVQRELGLKVDGKCGPATRAALLAPPVASNLGAAIVAIARSEIGNGETQGNNRGPDIDRYAHVCGHGPDSGILWCAAFASFCYVHGCEKVGIEPAPVAHARVRTLRDRVLAHGGRKLERPVPGCLVVVERGGPGGSAHARICAAVSVDQYQSIEGNSGPKVRAKNYRIDAPDLIGFYAWPGM